MKLAMFWGCKAPYYLPQHKDATQGILDALGVERVALDFRCCGYPAWDYDHMSYLYQAARNLALAQAEGVVISTICKCCFGAFRHAWHDLRHNPALMDEVRRLLKKDGLELGPKIEVEHILQTLHTRIGLERLRPLMKYKLGGVRLAATYGCHGLRPHRIKQFDARPGNPTIMEDLIGLSGAESVDYPRKLECCGYPLHVKNPEMSWKIARRKLDSALESEAEYLISACNYSLMQFDQNQALRLEDEPDRKALPALSMSQLLALCMGLSPKQVGLDQNHTPCRDLYEQLTPV